MEAFYKHSDGAVLSATIDKFMYISSHRFFDEDKIRVKYSKTETVTDIEQMNHPILREVIKKFERPGAIEISSNADIPAGTGLGSSSSFTVGLLHNLYTVLGKFVTKERLAAEAAEIEIERLDEPIGKQDHYAAAFGGLNVIKFNQNGTVDVEPIHLNRDIYKELQDSLLMVYIGQQRKTSSILAEQQKNLESKNKLESLKKMVELVWPLRESLYSGDLARFGRILHENWQLKRQLASKISNSSIDEIYQTALAGGATGGKLLGAGGGGFLLFCCEPKKQAKLKKALSDFRQMSFRFELEGSKLIYVGDENNES